MRTEVNIFQKGLISDIDPMIVPNGNWTFPTVHARIISKDGHGFIITEMKGNTEHFDLSNGFVPLGACEYNGVLYIASHNPSTGEGEIGSFPTPTGSGFTRIYTPLQNYIDPVTSVLGNLRTTLFNWDLNIVVDMFAKKSYDGSVDLYFCERKNPNRIINTNFTQGGAQLNRIYTDKHFNSYINQYPTFNNIISVDLDKIISPGELKCGIYIFYFRLMNDNFDVTNIVAESGPCQVYRGGSFGNANPVYDVGTVSDVEGGMQNEDSGKTIFLKLNNPDTTYKYIQIFYTRYFSNQDDVLVHETRQINTPYLIAFDVVGGITQTYMTLAIRGNETSALLNDVTLLRKYPIADRCKTHCSVENRYFGANWKDKAKHLDIYVDFCKRICISYSIEQKEAETADWHKDHSPLRNQYKDYKLTYDKVGYFRTEAYAFVALLELDDGTMTDGYPITGIDALMLNQVDIENMYDSFMQDMDVTPTHTYDYTIWHSHYGQHVCLPNTKGIFRFPGYGQHTKNTILNEFGVTVPVNTGTVQWKKSVIDNWIAPHVNILHPVFIYKYAMALLDDPKYTYIKDHVRAIHIARADRNKNLRYQGLMMVCSNSHTGNMVSYTGLYSYDDGNNTSVVTQFPPYAFDNAANGGIGSGIECNQVYEADGLFGTFRDPWNRYGHDPEHHSWFHTYNDALIPLYKAYCPAHYYKDKEPAGTHCDYKAININYLERMFFIGNKYAFYSYDFLFKQYNDIENINHFRRVLTWDRESNAKYFKGFDEWKEYWGNGQKGTPSIFPAVYMIDTFVSRHQYSPRYDYHDGYYLTNVPVLQFLPNPITPLAGGTDKYFEKIGESRPIKITDTTGLSYRFINSAMEYWQSPQNTMWFIHDTAQGDRDQVSTCRSMFAQKYIGIDIDFQVWGHEGDDDKDANHDIFNFYEKDPYDILDITTLYNPVELSYHIISKPYSVSELYGIYSIDHTNLLSYDLYRGDCFLQRSYFKQMYWNGSSFGNSELHGAYDEVGLDINAVDNCKATTGSGRYSNFTHGLIVGLILECENNVAMRSSGETNNYYPKVYDSNSFARAALNTNGIESLILNKGYNQQLSERSFSHYFKEVPYIVEEHETRIYHSGVHLESSFIDGFRTVLEGNYVDYSLEYGPIHKIFENQGKIISVQRDTISEHSTNQEQVKLPSNESELIIGTGPILSKKVQKLANYGTQHMTSVLNGYGVDWQRRIIWRVKEDDKKMTSVNIAEDLSTGKLIGKWFNDFAKTIDSQTDINQGILDYPRNGEGIVTGHDQKNKEIYFSFFKKVIIEVENGKDKYEMLSTGIIFNPLLIDAFETTFAYNPAMYMSLDDEFITFEMDNITTFHSLNKAWLEDSGIPLNFYGRQYEWQLSLYTQGSEGTQLVSKQFYSQMIHAEYPVFSKIEWETEFQKGELNPFVDPTDVRFYAQPEYLEHKWNVPIFVKTDPIEDQYQPDSDMRGTYLKTTLSYNGNIPIFIKEFLTNYEISKS